MTEAYADVLAAGASLDDEPRRHTYLRRFTATEEQRAAGSFEILFDGRDGNGEVLPAGVYRVSVVVRSSGSDSCDDPSWGAPGLISTVDWRP